MRRVEALVGTDAFRFPAREHVLVAQLTEQLKVRPEELPERVASLVSQLRDAERELDRFRADQVLAAAPGLAQHPTDVFGVAVVMHDAGQVSADDLRTLVLDVRGRFPAEQPAVVAAAGVAKERPLVVIATNDEARRWGVKAGDLVREAASVLGGGGGGKDDVAQGGGNDPQRVVDALKRVEHAVGERVTQAR